MSRDVYSSRYRRLFRMERPKERALLTGTSTYLTRLDESNAEVIRGWINDPETHRWMLAGHIPVSRRDELEFISASEDATAARTAFRFEVHALDDSRILGICGVEHVDLIHRHGELGIFIGSAEERGRGFGEDALRVLMRFAFDTLGLHNLRICALSGNAGARALYERLGFTVTGTDREAWYLDGSFHDLVRLDMLEAEYRASGSR